VVQSAAVVYIATLVWLWAGSLSRAESRHPPVTGAALACYVVVTEHGRISQQQALTLCDAAPSTGPAACYLRAQDELRLSEQQSIDLCRCARTSWPVDCFLAAERDTFLSESQIGALCSPISALGLLPSCQVP
jgi:hypothetical protein